MLHACVLNEEEEEEDISVMIYYCIHTNGDFCLIQLTKDISDAAIPMQLCCSPHYVEKDTRAPTDSVIPTRRKCILIGHRGALAIEKENTIRGYHAAIDIGCDMLEFGEMR